MKNEGVFFFNILRALKLEGGGGMFGIVALPFIEIFEKLKMFNKEE